ncbi:hypothetical protein BJX76DRAFT_318876 [Aspergillus varians]
MNTMGGLPRERKSRGPGRDRNSPVSANPQSSPKAIRRTRASHQASKAHSMKQVSTPLDLDAAVATPPRQPFHVFFLSIFPRLHLVGVEIEHEVIPTWISIYSLNTQLAEKEHGGGRHSAWLELPASHFQRSADSLGISTAATRLLLQFITLHR